MSDWLPWIDLLVGAALAAAVIVPFVVKRERRRKAEHRAALDRLDAELSRLSAKVDQRAAENDARILVIVAARAMFDGDTVGDFKRLREAVRALEEAEKGGGDE